MNANAPTGGRQVEIVVRSAIPVELLRQNVEASFARDLPRFASMPGLGKATGPVAIVGGGPSLLDTIDELRAFPGPIIGCGSVHDFLIDEALPPAFHVVVDPCVEVTQWMKRPVPGVTYLIASQCHPDLFDMLDGFDVRVWHALAITTDGKDMCEFRGEPPVAGGDFVIGRAWPIAAVMGHRDIHFFGFDCSFPADCDSQHAYGYDHDREEPCGITVEQTGERFLTTPGWMAQLNTFTKMLGASAGQFEITIHGRSLAASVLCKPAGR